MINLALIITLCILMLVCSWLCIQLRLERKKVRGSITVVDSEVVVSGIYLEGVTLDVREVGLCKLQRIHAHKCNPALIKDASNCGKGSSVYDLQVDLPNYRETPDD